MENPTASYPAILEAISTETEIENAIGKPSPKVLAKVLNALDEICRAFIARSPFVVVASSDAAGNLAVQSRLGWFMHRAELSLCHPEVVGAACRTIEAIAGIMRQRNRI